jgi:hypothetical protein
MMMFDIFFGIFGFCIALFMLGCLSYMGWEFFKWARNEWEREQQRRNRNVHT